jgi:hypothetical protein
MVLEWTETISNGLASRLNVVVFAILTVCALTLTWYFDLQSTMVGMGNLTTRIVPELPTQVATYSAMVIVAFTLMPTLLEIFTAGLARFNVKIVQIMIIGMTLFDILTDMPRAYELTMGFWPQIQQTGIFSPIIFWFVYLIVQLLATIGFELGAVVFGYATLIFIAKSTKSSSSPTQVHAPRSRTRRHAQPVQTPIPDDMGGVVIIDG